MQKIKSRERDLGGFSVTRILPHADKRMVGPFIFIDHMGPADFTSGDGIDVKPHPHIGLSTLTYLFEGALLHRDSLGNTVEIIPGDVNWMTAGKGIVHSERESIEVKASVHTLNGMQCWLALPKDKAEIEPSFTHIKKAQLPHFMADGVVMRLIAGDAYGMSSPIKTYSPAHYLDVLAKAGRKIQRPDNTHESAIYIVNGSVETNAEILSRGDFFVFSEADDATILAKENTRFMLLGGEPWSELPHIFWNFVSFSQTRIEQAKQDWQEGNFPQIPNDHQEFAPLP